MLLVNRSKFSYQIFVMNSSPRWRYPITYQLDTIATTGSATPTARRVIGRSARARNPAFNQQKKEKIPRGRTIPTGPFVRAEHTVNKIAIIGIPRYPRSHHAKNANNEPAILVARIVSTRQVDAARNHSEQLKRMTPDVNATALFVRLATKRKKAAEKSTNARAEGRRAVASFTVPVGSDANAMSQCENGGFDGTAPSYAGGDIQLPVTTIACATSASRGSPRV
jgi:hypothetical protein